MLQAEPRSDVYALGATHAPPADRARPPRRLHRPGATQPGTAQAAGRLSAVAHAARRRAAPLDALVRRMLAEDARRPAHRRRGAGRADPAAGDADPPRPRRTAPVLRPGARRRGPAARRVLQAFTPLAARRAGRRRWRAGCAPRWRICRPPSRWRWSSAHGDLLPVALVPYQVAARFENSAGRALHSVDEAGDCCWTARRPAALDLALGRFVAAHSGLPPAAGRRARRAGATPPPRVPFKAPPRKLEDQAGAALIADFCRTVQYTGENGRRYSKECKILAA